MIGSGSAPSVRARRPDDAERKAGPGFFTGRRLWCSLAIWLCYFVSSTAGAQLSPPPANSLATLTQVTGGVITGRVMDASGEPVIAVTVSAWRVRDANGHPLRRLYGGSKQTDDRGIYRLYHLPPGAYLIVANPNTGSASPNSPYHRQAPAYYPASTRDTAREVVLRGDEEVSGIDIRYRGEPGHIVSGRITGAVEAGGASNARLSILLAPAGGGAMISTSLRPGDPARGFSFYGVPDGEYELAANRENGTLSPPRRVVVKGADVTGIELALLPLGSIAGRVVFESSANAGQPAQCSNAGQPSFERTFVSARREVRAKSEEAFPFSGSSGGSLNEKGEFTIRNLEAGRYRLAASLPNWSWYLRAIALPGAAPAGTANENDAARAGLALKSGEKLMGVTVMVAENGAALRGRVMADQEGARLPARLRVHLAPAADEVLRYAETLARSDGTFVFGNLAPGKYWLLARAVPDDEPSDWAALPAAWDREGRAQLRREAEGAKNEIELQACQQVSN